MRSGGSRVKIADLPTTLNTAYNLQHLQIENLDIGAWKLGGTTSFTRELFGVDTAYYGPIDAASTFVDVQTIPIDPKIKIAKGEAEVAFTLSSKIADLESYDSNEVNQYISHVSPSIELPWTLLDLPKDGVNALVADCCASGALIVGKPIQWNEALTHKLKGKVQVSEGIDLVTEGNVENIIDGPLFALNEFLSLAQKHKLPLKPGQLVATGGCTSCEVLAFNKNIKVNFESIGEFDFILESEKND